jgi:hypothetical protein
MNIKVILPLRCIRFDYVVVQLLHDGAANTMLVKFDCTYVQHKNRIQSYKLYVDIGNTEMLIEFVFVIVKQSPPFVISLKVDVSYNKTVKLT